MACRAPTALVLRPYCILEMATMQQIARHFLFRHRDISTVCTSDDNSAMEKEFVIQEQRGKGD
jgi:hypothetical protein